LDFHRNRYIDGSRDGNIALNKLLYNLFNWVRYRSVHKSLYWDWNVDWDTNVDLTRDLNNFFDDIFHWIWNLSMSNVLYGVWNRFVNDLLDGHGDLDWHWNMHSSGNSCDLLYDCFDGVGDRSIDELFHRYRDVDVSPSFYGHTDGTVNNLFHGIGDVNPMIMDHVVWYGVRPVNKSLHGIRN